MRRLPIGWTAFGIALLSASPKARAEPLWQRASIDSLLVGGAYGAEPLALNRELERHGYSTLGTNAPAVGLAFHVGYRWFRFALDVDVSPDEVVQSETHAAEIRWTRIRVGTGYRAFLGNTTALVPAIDFALIGPIVTFELGSPPFALGSVSPTANRFDGSATAFDLGIELEQLLPGWTRSRDGSADLGPKLTMRLGYLRQVNSGGWRASDGDTDEPFRGPAIESSGPYIRLALGLGTGLDFTKTPRK